MPKPIPVESLMELFGQSVDGEAARAALAPLGEAQVQKFGASALWQFPPLGLTLTIKGKARKLEIIHVRSGIEPGAGRYPGALPFGLSWKLGRKAVVALLGKPERVLNDDDDFAFDDYVSRGMAINYLKRSPKDADPPIEYLMLLKPKAPKAK